MDCWRSSRSWCSRDFLLLAKTYLFKDIGSDTLNVFYPQLVSVARTLWRSGLPAGRSSRAWAERVPEQPRRSAQRDPLFARS